MYNFMSLNILLLGGRRLRQRFLMWFLERTHACTSNILLAHRGVQHNKIISPKINNLTWVILLFIVTMLVNFLDVSPYYI